MQDPVPRMWAHRPHPALLGRVRRISGFQERAAAPVFRREVPNGGVTLILGLDAEIRIASQQGEGTFASFVAGLHQIPVDTEHSGDYQCIQVDLSPLGAYQLLGIPMSELTDTVVGTEALHQPAWLELRDRLTAAPSWGQRFTLLEDTLGRWLQDGPVPDPAVRWAWQQLERTHGGVPIGALATEIGWSRRHFGHRFRQQVGLTPKPAAQVLRFAHALRLLAGSGSTSISAVAADAGYADHSHLARESRRLADATPSELQAAYGPAKVTFVQDHHAEPT